MLGEPVYNAGAAESAALRRTTPATFEGEDKRPIAQRMADAIVKLSKDGMPTHVSDLEHAGFTGGQIVIHFAEASRIARQTVVRDVNADIAGYDRNARVRLGADIVLGLMPNAGDMHAQLRIAGFGVHEEADLWSEIIARAADDFDAHHAPVPAPRRS